MAKIILSLKDELLDKVDKKVSVMSITRSEFVRAALLRHLKYLEKQDAEIRGFLRDGED